MILKDGVSLVALVPELDVALKQQIEPLFAAFGAEMWLTSGDERTTVHKGRPVAGDIEDPHYVGKAVDLRVWNVPEAVRGVLFANIAEALGCPDGPTTSPDGALVYQGPVFVIRWEYRGTQREHIHAQAGKVAVA